MRMLITVAVCWSVLAGACAWFVAGTRSAMAAAALSALAFFVVGIFIMMMVMVYLDYTGVVGP